MSKPYNKFKKGDKVMCVSNEHTGAGLEVGKGYEIHSEDFKDYYFLKGHKQSVYQSRLRPARVEEKPVDIRQVPDIKCACCYTTALKKVIEDHPAPGNILGISTQVNQPDLMGWLIIDYPYKDPYHMNHGEGVYVRVPFAEKTKVCPRCAPQVMGTVKHMADGWRK